MEEDAAVTPANAAAAGDGAVTLSAVQPAARSGDIAIVRQWLLEGGDPNTRLTGPRDTLLHLSLADIRKKRGDRSEMIRLLTAHGADVNIKYGVSRATALHLCEFPEETNLLIELGADVNAINHNGYSPLVLLSERCFGLALTRILVRHGADTSIVAFGRDAETAARIDGNLRVADFLADVRLAGGWRAYARAPRIELMRLRLLCARGRATPPQDPMLQRLFGVRASSTAKSARLVSRPLPKEVLWLVLAFWRASCDVDDDAIKVGEEQ